MSSRWRHDIWPFVDCRLSGGRIGSFGMRWGVVAEYSTYTLLVPRLSKSQTFDIGYQNGVYLSAGFLISRRLLRVAL